jgi:phage terminase large subunit-like protein
VTTQTTFRPAWLYDDSPIHDPLGLGQKAVDTIKWLRHPRSTLPGRALFLPPYFERVVRKVYGDVRENGQRKVKTVFALIPRGGRKTTLAGGLAMLHMAHSDFRVPRGLVVSGAVDRDQARLCYDEMRGMIESHPRMVEAFHIQDSRARITHKKSGCMYRALSSEAASAHGLTPVFAHVDELHAHKKPDLIDVIRTGLTKTPGSLLVVTTTSGIGRENIAYDMYAYARKVAAGEIDDESFLPLLWETSPDADWESEDVWRAVNPGLDYGFPDIDGLRTLAREAKHRPAQREAFKQLHLNVWLDGAAEPAWDMAVWDQNADAFDLDALQGCRAWIAADLSRQLDITSVATVIELPDERLALHVQSFCPEEGIRKRAGVDSAPYPLWVEQGYLTACPGDTVDLSMVEEHIRKHCDLFNVQEVNFDKYGARQLMKDLDDDGLPVVEFPQNLMTYTPAVNAFERAMFERKLCHGNNPLVRWAVSNVVLYSDANFNRRPDKKRAPDRIDPATASIMAVGRALADDGKRILVLTPDELLA